MGHRLLFSVADIERAARVCDAVLGALRVVRLRGDLGPDHLNQAIGCGQAGGPAG